MPKYYCDYCDRYLTHDSPSVRKTHVNGKKHRDSVREYYQKWLEQQVQKINEEQARQAKRAQKIGLPPVPFPGAAVRLGMPPPGFGAPPPGFGMPPPGFGMPPPGFGAAPPPFVGMPPPGFAGGMMPPGGMPPPHVLKRRLPSEDEEDEEEEEQSEEEQSEEESKSDDDNAEYE